MPWIAACGGALMLVVSAGDATDAGARSADRLRPHGETSARLAAEAESLDRGLLARADEIFRDSGRVLSLVVMKEGALVHERYYRGRARRFDTYSVTKSITSTLLGIALADGALTSLDVRVVAALAEDRLPAGPSPRLERLTLRHLVSMQSGFRHDPRSPWAGSGSDWAASALARPFAADPGARFTYDNGNYSILMGALEHALDVSIRVFAHRRLFQPLGISNYSWAEDPSGSPIGPGGIQMTARDMAKLGQLFLQHGRWRYRQVVPRAWVAAATRRQSGGGFPERRPYGYGWWVGQVRGARSFFAAGFGGQYVYVAPRFDLVVTTAEPYFGTTPLSSPLPVIERYVVGAVR